MAIVFVGIDLAKNVFAVHGVNEAGKATLVKSAVPRAKLEEVVAVPPPCVIGLEACSGAHHWARSFQAHGHTVKLMAPKFVAPYRLSGKRGKNDAADAQAIREAGSRMRPRARLASGSAARSCIYDRLKSTRAKTRSEWSPAERLVSGPAPATSVTRPPVDVQSVHCGHAASQREHREDQKGKDRRPVLDSTGSPCRPVRPRHLHCPKP